MPFGFRSLAHDLGFDGACCALADNQVGVHVHSAFTHASARRSIHISRRRLCVLVRFGVVIICSGRTRRIALTSLLLLLLFVSEDGLISFASAAADFVSLATDTETDATRADARGGILSYDGLYAAECYAAMQEKADER